MHKPMRPVSVVEKPSVETIEVEKPLLPIADDWEAMVDSSTQMADIIDKHLDFESKLQGRELRPVTLCPEQRASLATDLSVL